VCDTVFQIGVGGFESFVVTIRATSLSLRSIAVRTGKTGVNRYFLHPSREFISEIGGKIVVPFAVSPKKLLCHLLFFSWQK
jgi:hypothetical protein